MSTGLPRASIAHCSALRKYSQAKIVAPVARNSFSGFSNQKVGFASASAASSIIVGEKNTDGKVQESRMSYSRSEFGMASPIPLELEMKAESLNKKEPKFSDENYSIIIEAEKLISDQFINHPTDMIPADYAVFAPLENNKNTRKLTGDVLHSLIEANEISQLKQINEALILETKKNQIINLSRKDAGENKIQKAYSNERDFSVLLAYNEKQNIQFILTRKNLNSYRGEDGWGILHWLVHHAGKSVSSDGFDDCGKVGCCEGEETDNDPKSLEVLINLTKTLVEKFGIDINMRTEYDQATPLMYAVEGRSEVMIKTLLKYNADPLLEDDDGDNAFDWEKSNNGGKKLPSVLQKCIEEVEADAVNESREALPAMLAECVEIVDEVVAPVADKNNSVNGEEKAVNQPNPTRPEIIFPTPKELINMEPYLAISKYFYDCIEDGEENAHKFCCPEPESITDQNADPEKVVPKKDVQHVLPIFIGTRILPACLLKIFIDEDNVSEKLLANLACNKIQVDKTDIESFFSEEGWSVLHWCAHKLSPDAGIDACDQCGRLGMGEDEDDLENERNIIEQTKKNPTHEHTADVKKRANICELVTTLVRKCNVNPDIPGIYDGATPLMNAAIRDKNTPENAPENPLVELLLELGADKNLKDHDGNDLEWYREG